MPLAPGLGYLISKGGITTQTLLADGLGLESVELKGQLMPGVYRLFSPSVGVAKALPIVTFPGNLGTDSSLFEAWQRMQAG